MSMDIIKNLCHNTCPVLVLKNFFNISQLYGDTKSSIFDWHMSPEW